ncbi:MAG TPA: hypothetical protein VEZ70_09600 [Allosphingosinicella sp.]|nr:hypothetical protein [Allosphingosinicella sp.]
MKTSPVFLLLALAACGSSNPETPQDAMASAAEGAERIECAVGGSQTFEPVCAVERVTGSDGLTLTLRSPSGGFRRLLVTTDGRGVIAADGAEQAVVTPLGPDRIEVVLAGDRYRLPATVKQ